MRNAFMLLRGDLGLFVGLLATLFMGRKFDKCDVGGTILVLVFIFHAPSHEAVEARRPWNKNVESPKKFTLKTIKRVDGDIIDCIDIYKQPAFDHPLLQNHTIQMRPSTYPFGMEEGKTSPVDKQQLWKLNEECPPGTIPILRNQIKSDKGRRHVRHLNGNIGSMAVGSPFHDHAVAYVQGEKYYGASASISVWNPRVEALYEFSLSQIWLVSGAEDDINTIEAGWTVDPLRHGDNKTRIFIYWTSNNYATGCYNLDCSGFVQVSNDVLGGVIYPVSVYEGAQFMINIAIFKDTENWWLRVQDKMVGYWPGSLFTGLGSSGADLVEWGGEVVNSRPERWHTATQMGSGHFPGEGFRKASFFRDMQILDANNAVKSTTFKTTVTAPGCYGVQTPEDQSTDWGSHFFVGGPGRSATCP